MLLLPLHTMSSSQGVPASTAITNSTSISKETTNIYVFLKISALQDISLKQRSSMWTIQCPTQRVFQYSVIVQYSNRSGWNFSGQHKRGRTGWGTVHMLIHCFCPTIRHVTFADISLPKSILMVKANFKDSVWRRKYWI